MAMLEAILLLVQRYGTVLCYNEVGVELPPLPRIKRCNQIFS